MKLFFACIVLACVLMASTPLHAAPSPYSGRTITRIDLVDSDGAPWPKPEQILPLINIKPGDQYSSSAIRDGLSLLYYKGMFLDIQIDAAIDGDGVRVTYILFPITIVDRIELRGNDAISNEKILETIPRVVGRELRGEKLPGLVSDIAALYQACGYFGAVIKFHPEQIPGKHSVILHLEIAEGPPTTIENISFEGITAFTADELELAINSRVGGTLNRDQLLDADMAAIEKKYLDAGFPSAKPGPVDTHFENGHALVRIVIKEGPRVRVTFVGNRIFKEKDLNRALLIWTEHDASNAAIEGSADKIKRMYREGGYADVAVETSTVRTPELLAITFKIEEGPRVTVRSISFQGMKEFSEKTIKAEMGIEESGWWKWWRPVYREDFLVRDIDNLRDRYAEAGFLSATVRKTMKRSGDGRSADIVLDVTEGQKTHVGAVEYIGNNVFSAAELLEKAGLKPGSAFVERQFDEDRYKILSAYTNKGYLFSRVDIERTVRGNELDLRYRISEDRQVRIGRIILKGNDTTRDEVILRELQVKPGDPYDYNAILASQQQIYRLGLFKLVKFEPTRPGEHEYVQDMLLTIEERPSGAIEVGVGYGDLDRLRGFVELSHRNILGTSRYSSLRFEESDILKRGIFNFQEPWFLDRKMDARFSLIWSDSEKLNSDTREVYYSTRKTAASFGVEKTHDALKPSLTYQFENIVNYNVLQAAQITTEDSGRVQISSLSPALILDLRDDVFNPHRGAIYGIVLKEAFRELGSQADFSKLTVQASWFLPLGQNVLALSSRIGLAWPYRNTTEVPIHERFYVGGGTSVRGYTQDSIGPSALDASGNAVPQGGASLTVLNAELRISQVAGLAEGLGVVLFVDAGNVWSNQEINLVGLRQSIGAGIRYNLPIGPVRLDYGQKIHRLAGESPGEFHFNIGNAF